MDGNENKKWDEEPSNIYEIKSPDEDLVREEAISQSVPPASGTTPPVPQNASTPSGSEDIYGVGEIPTEVHVSDYIRKKNLQRQLDLLAEKKRLEGKKQEKSVSSSSFNENKEFSLDEIYSRRRQQAKNTVDENEEPSELPELPRHPFFTRLLTPFYMVGFLFRFSIMIAGIFLPILGVLSFYIKRISWNEGTRILPLRNFLNCLWEDKVLQFFFCFGLSALVVPPLFHIFTQTANGDDKFEDWPELNIVGGIGQFLWLLVLGMIGGLPGYILGSFFGVGFGFLGFIISVQLLTPIFFLSCMESDTLFLLITKTVLKSLVTVWKAWLKYYILVATFLFCSLSFIILVLWYIAKESLAGHWSDKPVAALILSILFGFVPAIILRWLGRLAWIIADDANKRQAENENKEAFSEENEEDDEDEI